MNIYNFIVLSLLIFLLLTMGSCTTYHTQKSSTIIKTNREAYTWYFSPVKERAVAIVVHGLNTLPDKMLSIIQLLTEQGVHVLNLRLSGHRGNSDEMKKVTRDIWLSEINKGFELTHEYADKKNLPILFTGFSLGAVVGLDAASSNNKKLFDYALLFAPAITVNWYTCLVKLCFLFGNGFIIPSKTPPAYRANKGTTVAAYKSLFSHIRKVNKADCPLANIPCLCFIDPDDEFVYSKGLLTFILKKKWTNWEVVLLEKDLQTAIETYHHLIIDAQATGAGTWRLIESRITQFFDIHFLNK